MNSIRMAPHPPIFALDIIPKRPIATHIVGPEIYTNRFALSDLKTDFRLDEPILLYLPNLKDRPENIHITLVEPKEIRPKKKGPRTSKKPSQQKESKTIGHCFRLDLHKVKSNMN
jgi:hypothetical protein